MASFKEMVKSGAIKRADAMQVELKDIHEEPGFNLREEGADLDASIEALADHIAGGGQYPALEVRPRDEGGVWVVDGHRRRRALLRCLARGVPLASPKDQKVWVHVVAFTGNDGDRVARVITSAEGKSLSQLEVAKGFKRLVAFGWTPTDALTRLSFLGNGDFPGNSEGNRIAQKAVSDIKQALAQQEQCGCHEGECETKKDKTCRMTIEIAERDGIPEWTPAIGIECAISSLRDDAARLRDGSYTPLQIADDLDVIANDLAKCKPDAQQEQPASVDAYVGAREDAAIWKKRALEAEELNRKFIADVNGSTYLGEPAQQEQPSDSEYARGFGDGQKEFAEIAGGAWQTAVTDQLVVHHIYQAIHDTDPRKAINDLLCISNDIALDPRVSSDAQALIDRGRREAQQEQPASVDAYVGAREDAAIWKKRALEAEELNRKFIAELNGPTSLGEPAKQEQPAAWTRKGSEAASESFCTVTYFDTSPPYATYPAQEQPAQEPVMYQYRWTNPGDNKDVPEFELDWKTVEPRNPNTDTIESRIKELEGYRYNGKPCYEVRALFAAPPTQPAQLSDDEILNCFYASKSEGMVSYMIAVGRAIEAHCRGGQA